MKIDISFLQITPNESVKAYTEERSQTLKRYFDGRIHVIWHFSKEHGEVQAKCQLKGPQMDYHGEEIAETLEKAIDLTIDKVERQIRKHKEIVTDHKRG